MMGPIVGAGSGAVDEAERLRRVAQQLEGVFVQELFKAMRQTVPEGGTFNGGTGEEIFTALFDQEIAEQVPEGWQRGLADALYRQLAGVAGIAAESTDITENGETE